MVGRWSSRYQRAGLCAAVFGGLTLMSLPGGAAPGGPAPGGEGLPVRPVQPVRPSPRIPQPPIAPGNRRGLPTPPGKPGNRPPSALPAVPPAGNEIMSVKDVKPGMRGYGLTVFRGTKLERFDVEVVGVMPKANMGEPLVLVRLSGGPITARGAYLIQGMSGSPIYVNGKLLGAFSQGDSWPKEPLGMVTPIEDMLEALDPKLPPIPAGATAQDNTFDLPVMASADTPENGVGIFRGPETVAINAAGRSFRQLALPVSVGGLSQRNLERTAQVLSPFNMSVMQGPGGMAEPFKAELGPGAGVGVVLLSGDVDMSAIGTVTYRKGNDLLGFGHPMMQVGAAQFPISSVWVHDVFPGMPVSYKIGSAGELKGTLTQDRPFSIAAKVGPLPSMIPIRCSVDDKETGRARTFNVRAANHPLLVGQLLPIAVNQGLFQIRPVPGDTVAKVKLAVETDGAGTISRENVFFDPSSIDVLAIRELQELMGLLANNSFRRVPIKSLNVDVTYEAGRPTATVDRIFLPQDKFEPGDEVEVGVVMRPYRKEPVITKTKIRIPENAANGRAMLLVQGGSTRVNVLPPATGGIGISTPQTAPPDASLRQVLNRFEKRERNDEIVTRLLFPTTAVNIKGERLSQLPSTILNVMRSSKTTGLRVERDEAKVRTHSEYLCDGVQTLEITIEKKDHTEKPTTVPGRLGAGGSGTLSLPTSTPTRGTLSTGDDLEDLSTVNFTVDGKLRTVKLAPMPARPARIPLTLTPEEEEDGEAVAEPKTDTPRASEPKAEKPSEGKGKGTKGKTETSKSGKKSEGTAPTTGASTPSKTEDSSEKKSDESADDKVLGRPASHWTQSSQRDFEAGTMVNIAVSSNGEVRLAPGLKLQHESPEQYVWSVLGMNGAVFAGTGNTGQVLKVDGEGKGSVFFRTKELEVHALAKDKVGNLYAGTSPNGKIFKIAPDGQGKEIFSMNGDRTASDPEVGGKFVLSMATAADGTIFAGTGPEGRIYRLRPNTETPEELCRIPGQSITSLLAAPDGMLYAGTAEDGALYKIQPAEAGGKPSVVYETNQAAVTGIAMDGSGKLYLACAPSGDIYRIDTDGTPRLHFDKVRAPVYSLLADPTGNLYAAAADSILRIEPSGIATIISDEKKGQFTSLAWDENGRLVAGSVNVGSVYRLQPSVAGSFESTVHDAKVPARWGRVRYAGMLPAGATLTLKTRSGNTPEPGSTWSDWSAPVSREGGVYITSPMGRFLQYRVELTGTQGQPALREITIAYLRNNQAPKLTLASPGGGEIWKGSQNLRWSALDADADTLTYQLSYSADGGRTWKPVGESADVKEKPAPAAGTPPTPDKEAIDSALERYRKQLDEDKTLSAQDRTEKFQRAKAMIDNYLKEHPTPPGATPTPPARTETPTAAARAAGITRQASFNWDTKQVPDGIYILRVIASDQASNPTGALSDTQVSEPFIIANTPPQVFLLERGAATTVAQITETGRTQTISGFSTGRVSLKGAQFRLNDGDWTALEAEDGLWDSAFEHFRARFPAVTSGEQTLEVKVVDVAGNVQVAKAKVGPAGIIANPPPAKAPEGVDAKPSTPAPAPSTEEKPKRERKSRKK